MFYYLFCIVSIIQSFFNIYQLIGKKESIMDIQKYTPGTLSLKEYIKFGGPIVLGFVCLFQWVQYGEMALPEQLHSGIIVAYFIISFIYQWANFLMLLEIKNGHIKVENNDLTPETVSYLFGNKRMLLLSIIGSLSTLLLIGGSLVVFFILIF